jgi:ribosome-associated toxin RatA of RatAB toxin-antitoxin module
MKLEVNNKEQNAEIKYPCLMISDNYECIVLMQKEETGIALKHENQEMGYFSNMWDMSEFKPFNGTITLSND